MLKFVVMVRDELGDCFRAHGSEFLEAVHCFPKYDPENEAMWYAFSAWRESIEEQANKAWQEAYGSECHCFIERLYSTLSYNEIVEIVGNDFF